LQSVHSCGTPENLTPDGAQINPKLSHLEKELCPPIFPLKREREMDKDPERNKAKCARNLMIACWSTA